MPQISQETYTALLQAILDGANIRAKEKELATQRADNDATLKALGVPLLDEKRTLISGVTYKQLLTAEYDEQQALAFALDSANVKTHAGILKFRKEALADLIGLLADHHPERLAFFLEIDSAGYTDAVVSKAFVGIPHTGIAEKWSVAIELKRLDASEMEQKFIMSDEAPVADTAPTPEIVTAEPTTPLAYEAF